MCNVVRMPRTCESIARLKIEHKKRAKCCNLQHFALSDGKNLRKYHSFSPRRWIKHCYLQGFAHVTIFDFWKTAKYSVFLHSSRQKIGSNVGGSRICQRTRVEPAEPNLRATPRTPPAANPWRFSHLDLFEATRARTKPCGWQLPLLNVAFWTDKKLTPNSSSQASKTLASQHRNTMEQKDGQSLQLAAACA